jgi:abortive infection bacteriophage resistance protein
MRWGAVTMLDVLYKIDTNIKSQIQPLTMKIKTYSYFYPDYIDKYVHKSPAT